MAGDRPSDHIRGLPDPLSESPWSDDFVMQAIEILPVSLRGGQIWSFQPEHADSFLVSWPARARPEEVAARALAQLGTTALVLHSTSWRNTGDEVVLTYLAVVAPTSPAPPSWQTVAVGRSELARGDATAPPQSIGVLQVLEHALRHLAWLTKDDPIIAHELADWSVALTGYVPEPFRAFGGVIGPS